MPLTVAPVTLSPASFSTGIGSPVTIDSSTALRPSIDHAVDRHLLARPDAQQVADLDLLERHVFLAAVGAHAPRRLRREPEQRAIALPVGRRARSSSTWPSSTSVVITAAASK